MLGPSESIFLVNFVHIYIYEIFKINVVLNYLLECITLTTDS